MKWFKENWFKIGIVLVVIYCIQTVPSAYIDKQLWAQERLHAFEKCVATVFPDPTANLSQAGYSSAYDAYKAAFRACKNVSDVF